MELGRTVWELDNAIKLMKFRYKIEREYRKRYDKGNRRRFKDFALHMWNKDRPPAAPKKLPRSAASGGLV